MITHQGNKSKIIPFGDQKKVQESNQDIPKQSFFRSKLPKIYTKIDSKRLERLALTIQGGPLKILIYAMAQDDGWYHTHHTILKVFKGVFSRRAVERHIKTLSDNRYLIRTPKHHPKTGKIMTRYYLFFDAQFRESDRQKYIEIAVENLPPKMAGGGNLPPKNLPPKMAGGGKPTAKNGASHNKNIEKQGFSSQVAGGNSEKKPTAIFGGSRERVTREREKTTTNSTRLETRAHDQSESVVVVSSKNVSVKEPETHGALANNTEPTTRAKNLRIKKRIRKHRKPRPQPAKSGLAKRELKPSPKPPQAPKTENLNEPVPNAHERVQAKNTDLPLNRPQKTKPRQNPEVSGTEKALFDIVKPEKLNESIKNLISKIFHSRGYDHTRKAIIQTNNKANGNYWGYLNCLADKEIDFQEQEPETYQRPADTIPAWQKESYLPTADEYNNALKLLKETIGKKAEPKPPEPEEKKPEKKRREVPEVTIEQRKLYLSLRFELKKNGVLYDKYLIFTYEYAKNKKDDRYSEVVQKKDYRFIESAYWLETIPGFYRENNLEMKIDR